MRLVCWVCGAGALITWLGLEIESLTTLYLGGLLLVLGLVLGYVAWLVESRLSGEDTGD